MPLPICTTRRGSGLLLGPEFGYATALNQNAHPTFRRTLSHLSTDSRISSKDKLEDVIVAAFGWDEAFYLCYRTVRGRLRQTSYGLPTKLQAFLFPPDRSTRDSDTLQVLINGQVFYAGDRYGCVHSGLPSALTKALASDQRNGISPRFVAFGKDSSYVYVDHQECLHHQLHDYQADVRSILDGQRNNIKYLYLDPHNGKNYMCVMNDGSWQGFFHSQHCAGGIKALGVETMTPTSLEDAHAPKVAPCIAEMQLDMQQQLHQRVQEVRIAYQEQAEADKAAAEQVLSNSLDEAGRTLQKEFRSLEQLLRRKGQDRHTDTMTDSPKHDQDTVAEDATTTRQLVQSYSSLALGMIKEHRKRLERLRRLVVRNLEVRDAEPEVTYVPAEGRQVRLSLSTALAMSPFFPGFGHMRRLQQSPQYRLGMSLGLRE